MSLVDSLSDVREICRHRDRLYLEETCSRLQRTGAKAYVCSSKDEVLSTLRCLEKDKAHLLVSNRVSREFSLADGLSDLSQLRTFPSPEDMARQDHKVDYGDVSFEALHTVITGANGLVAPSGTLVLAEYSGELRSLTSLPLRHIVLLFADKLVDDLTQATRLVKGYASCFLPGPMPRFTSFITGPSKTADIEKKLVYGIHGPQELWIVLVSSAAREESLAEWLRT